VPNSFNAVIVGSTVIGMLINFIGIKSDHGAVLDGCAQRLPRATADVVIMLVSNNRKVMGKRTNTPLINVLGWAATIIMLPGHCAGADFDSSLSSMTCRSRILAGTIGELATRSEASER